MKSILVIAARLGIVAGTCGCQSAQPGPPPGLAQAQIRVTAIPKTGATAPVAHVAVYDAAPSSAKSSGKYEHVDYSNLSNVIVWLERVPSSAAPQSGASMPVPREVLVTGNASETVHPASIGQRVILTNGSARSLSLYSVSEGNDFELAPIAPGASGEFRVRSEGLIEILSDPSQPPTTLIYAAPSPWVARAKARQTVTFNDIPPGDYRVMSWHPRLPGSSTRITVAPGQVARVGLSVGVGALAQTRE